MPLRTPMGTTGIVEHMADEFLAFVLFIFTAALSPGGANTLATASGIQFGYRRSLGLISGMVAGMFCLPAAASFGLGALLQTLPVLQMAMKVIGSLYLLWLAWRIGMAGQPQSGEKQAQANGDGQSQSPIGFLTGFALLLLNPKAWAMSFAAGASFVSLAANPILLALIIGGGFALAALTALTLWCLSGVLFARILRTERQWRAVNITLGILLMASIVPLWV